MKKNNEKENNQKGNKNSKLLVIIALIAACIVRFSGSYEDLDDEFHSKMWMGISFLMGITGEIIFKKKFMISALLITVGFIIAIILRMIFDMVFIDPTSHNLFPIELIIWSVMAFIPALAGTFLGSIILRIFKKIQDNQKATKNKS